jgi:hypothetical protein
MKLNLLILLMIFLLLSCRTETNDKKVETQITDLKQEEEIFPQVNDEFDSFLRHFDKTKLPTEIKGCYLSEKDIKEFKGDHFRKYVDEYHYGYKQIPANGTFVATITLGAADCFLPVLTTFKLTGEKIDSKSISIGYCGSDCGYSCEEYMIIKEDYSIYVSDTISSSECDSIGNIIPGTTENYVIYKTGQLLKNGKIELSEEIRKELEE